MKLRILPVLVVAIIFLAGVSTASRGLTLRYEGSPAIGKFIELSNQVYGKCSFMTNVKTKSRGGEESISKGASDIGGVANELKPSLQEQGITGTLIGKDEVAVIVNENNPVTELSLAQLKDIFSGKITTWKEVGGPDLAIEVLITSPISATHDLFKRVVMNGDEYKARVMEPEPTILLTASRNKGAIGFVSQFVLNGKPQGVQLVKPNGEQPSIANPNYPLSRPLYLLTKNHPPDEVKAFIDWTLSNEGQNLLKTVFHGVE